MSSLTKRLHHLGLFVLAVTMLAAPAAVAFADDTTPGYDEEVRCFQDLRDCYYGASRERSFVDRTLHALDCDLGFIGCTRRALDGR